MTQTNYNSANVTTAAVSAREIRDVLAALSGSVIYWASRSQKKWLMRQTLRMRIWREG